MHSPDERSISQLLGDSLSELAKLIQNEVDIIRAELLEKVSHVGGAAKLIGVGAVLMIPALVPDPFRRLNRADTMGPDAGPRVSLHGRGGGRSFGCADMGGR